MVLLSMFTLLIDVSIVDLAVYLRDPTTTISSYASYI